MPALRRALLAALACCLPGCHSGASDTSGGGGPPVTQVPPQGRTDWTNGAVVYEIFVRSFQDSDGDGKGDLRGLISRLDYLNDGDPNTSTDLGVDAIWLMPVFSSPSYHGYDVSDYEQINPDYGTLADFQQLCAEAHKRGMKVILDFVMNHTSSQHPWFVDSSSSTSSPRRDWYVWSGSDPGWTQPWGNTPSWHPSATGYFYGLFWEGMPDLNYRTPAVQDEIQRLAQLWLSLGADGFRLDAARYLVEDGTGNLQEDTPETHQFWKQFAAGVRATRQDALLVGEAWADTSTIARYYGSTTLVPGGDELPLNFDFPLASALIQGINSGSASGIARTLSQVQATYPPGAADAPFLTNHDMIRLATQVGGDPGRERNAAALLLTLPGTPFLYYGEEVGLLNGNASDGDAAKRAPMAWDATANGGFTTGAPWYPLAAGKETTNVATQTGDGGSLLSRYRKLIRAHKASSALVRGGLQLLTSTTGASSTLAFLRTDGTERVLVVHNLSDGSLSDGPYSLPDTSAEPLFVDGSVSLAGGPGSWWVTLGGRGTGVWRLH